ncbi:MAG: ABC transporter ATP-binding protein [Thermoanaerobaculia bacterium]
MIEIKGLKKYFKENLALDEINLEIKKGEIFGFVGSDGAGKTTILRILSGILKPSSGYVLFENKEKISYVPQRFSLYEDLTLMENLNFFSEIYQIKDKEKIEEILSFLNLSEFKNFYAGNLSGGMKQKLSLACALLSEPEILLLDEPTNGLDPLSRRDLWEIFYKISNEGVTIVLTTSYFEEAEKCKRVALIDKGKILEEGSPKEIINSFRFPVMEILTDSPKILSENIKSLNFVLESLPLGERVHIILKDIKFKENLIEILKEKGFGAKDIKFVPPSIEDIFICKLTENEK